MAKYTEPCIADTGGVVGSWSPRVSHARGCRITVWVEFGRGEKQNLRNSCPGVRVNVHFFCVFFPFKKWTQAICLATYTEPCIAEPRGVVGSWSPRLQQVRGSNPGGGGSLFGWILAAGKKDSEKFLPGC